MLTIISTVDSLKSLMFLISSSSASVRVSSSCRLLPLVPAHHLNSSCPYMQPFEFTCVRCSRVSNPSGEKNVCYSYHPLSFFVTHKYIVELMSLSLCPRWRNKIHLFYLFIYYHSIFTYVGTLFFHIFININAQVAISFHCLALDTAAEETWLLWRAKEPHQ